MKHLLVPVPARHVAAARETLARSGRVAFGSNAFDVLNRQRGQDVTVWIAASATGGPVPGVHVGHVILKGRLAGIVDADRRGRHPDPSLRPDTTSDDGQWGQFLEVDEVTDLAPTLPVVGLVTVQGQKLQRLPQGPLPIRDPGAAP
jgi:hypothetical protein